MEKYRVHEVAKDFGLSTKEIAEILTKYAETPKNHMQVLTDGELSIIFEKLTQDHPVSGIQAIFADVQAAEKAEPKKDAKPKKQPVPAGQPAPKAAQPAQQQAGKPQQGQQQGKAQPVQQAKPQQPVQQPVSRVPQKRIGHSRKSGAVNRAKHA